MNKRQDKTILELYADAILDVALLQNMWDFMQENPDSRAFDPTIQRSIMRAQIEAAEIKERYESKQMEER